MAIFNLANLLGRSSKKADTSSKKANKSPAIPVAAKPHDKDKKAMNDFSHLHRGSSSAPRADEQYNDQQTQQRLDGNNSIDTVVRPGQCERRL